MSSMVDGFSYQDSSSCCHIFSFYGNIIEYVTALYDVESHDVIIFLLN